MEEFLSEIESYAAAVNLSPGTVVQYSTKRAQGGGAFSDWKAGKVSPTMATVDKVRAFMRDNPPPEPPETLPAPEAEGGEAAA